MKKTTILLLSLILIISISLSSSLYGQSNSYTIGIETGNSVLIGDYNLNKIQLKPKVGLRGGYYVTDNLILNLSLGYNQIEGNNIYTDFYPISFFPRLYLLRQSPVAPFLELGIGTNLGISSSQSTKLNTKPINNVVGLVGIGLDIPITDNVGLIINSQFNYTNNNYYDNNIGEGFSGNFTDAYLEMDLGVEVNLTSIFSEDEQKQVSQVQPKDTAESTGTIQRTGTDTVYKTQTKVKTDTVYKEQAPTTTTDAVDKDSLLALQQKLKEKDRTLQNYEDLLADHNNKINSLIKLLKQKNQKINELSGGESSEREEVTSTTLDPSKLPETAQNAKEKIQEDKAANTEAQDENIRTQYKQTLQLVYNEEYEAAIQNFQELLQKYPDHRLAGNFIYWTGEAYFALKDYREAVQQFTQLEQQYPNSNKLDDALLMAGKCYKLIGQPSQARRKFRKLVDNYPDSEYTQQARALLRDL